MKVLQRKYLDLKFDLSVSISRNLTEARGGNLVCSCLTLLVKTLLGILCFPKTAALWNVVKSESH